jgi:hypothetical protein
MHEEARVIKAGKLSSYWRLAASQRFGWIPACAGMTESGYSCAFCRHSSAGWNPSALCWRLTGTCVEVP